MRGFYNLPKFIQWIIAILLMVIGFVPMLPIMAKPYGLLFLPILAPILNLVSVPFFRLIGYYKYLTPLVLSTVQTDKEYDLHNVFTFDYLVNFKWADRGKKVQKTLLAHYFKALLVIIERIETEQLPSSVNIVGHSYFFSDRTTQKLGFTISKANSFWTVNSCLQFIELTYLYSFSQGKLAFPKFWKVRRAEILGHHLVQKKTYLQGLVNKLELSIQKS